MASELDVFVRGRRKIGQKPESRNAKQVFYYLLI